MNEERGSNVQVQVFETVEAAQEAAARHIADRLQPTGVGQTMSLALSGGSTPRRMHEILADLPGIDWTRVQVFWGDERTVPPDDPASNFGMARDSLLTNVMIPKENIHRIKGELDPADAASHYEGELRAVLGGSALQPPRLDINVLGIGPDGHTASLFPGTDALDERERWVVANWVPQQDTWRVTLTYPVLNAARLTMFLVAGADKADALYRIFSPSVQDKPPAASVQPDDGEVVFYLDQAAAEGIDRAKAELTS